MKEEGRSREGREGEDHAHRFIRRAVGLSKRIAKVASNLGAKTTAISRVRVALCLQRLNILPLKVFHFGRWRKIPAPLLSGHMILKSSSESPVRWRQERRARCRGWVQLGLDGRGRPRRTQYRIVRHRNCFRRLTD